MISKEWKLAHTHMRQNISKKTLLSKPHFCDKIPSYFGDTIFIKKKERGGRGLRTSKKEEIL